MLPNFLYDTYQQYKADTEKIATWLAETAKHCGWAEANEANGTTNIQSNKAPKLKGRARKLARDAAAAEKAGAPSKKNVAKEQMYIIRMKDFVPMAQLIAHATDSAIKMLPAACMRLDSRQSAAARRKTPLEEDDRSLRKLWQVAEGRVDRSLLPCRCTPGL